MIIIHFLIALALVLFFSILAYVIYFYTFGKLFIWIYKKLKKKDKEFKVTIKHPKVKKVFLAFTVINIAIFLYQFVYWGSAKNSANLNAKPYFAAGNTMGVYRSMTASIIGPDFFLWVWITVPQQITYDIAKKVLPKDDGEIDVYGYQWFVYPYARVYETPAPFYTRFIPLRKLHSVEQYSFNYIDSILKDNFADKNLYETKVIVDLPLASLHIGYDFQFNRITNVSISKEVDEEIANTPVEYSKYYKRRLEMEHYSQEEKAKAKKEGTDIWMKLQLLYRISTIAYEALKKVSEEWEDSLYIQNKLKNNPKLQAMMIAAKVNTLQDSALGFKLYKKTLSCNDSYILDYIKQRQALEDIAKKHPRRGVKQLRDYYNYHLTSEYFKYLFDTYCGYSLAGSYDTQFGTGPSRYESMTKEDGAILLKNKQQLNLNKGN
jgi:hypothetical protein